MQRFIFEGRLAKDSELKYLPNSNNAVLSFDVAVNEGYGDYKKTDFFNCAVFGKRAESLSSYLIKGTQVICVGEVHINKKDGKQYVSVKVNDIQMLSKAKKDDPFDMYKEDKTFEEPVDCGDLPF